MKELRAKVICYTMIVLADWTWRKVEDSRAGDEELLVAGGDKGCGKVCRRM